MYAESVDYSLAELKVIFDFFVRSNKLFTALYADDNIL